LSANLIKRGGQHRRGKKENQEKLKKGMGKISCGFKLRTEPVLGTRRGYKPVRRK